MYLYGIRSSSEEDVVAVLGPDEVCGPSVGTPDEQEASVSREIAVRIDAALMDSFLINPPACYNTSIITRGRRDGKLQLRNLI